MRALFAKLSVWVVVVTALVATTPLDSHAHSGVQSYLYLDVTPDRLGGRVEMPYSDLREVFGYGLDGDHDAVLGELQANKAEIAAYLRHHMSVGAEGREWHYEITEIDLLWAEGGYAVVRFLADVPDGGVPRTLDVRLDPFFDEIEHRDALLLIGNDWEGGVIDNGEEVFVSFDPAVRRRQIDLGAASQWSNFTASLGLGVDHIRTGPDHILFVLVLLLPSVLVFQGGWKPVSTFGASLWRILAIVSMFTLAHSITFVLVGLQVLPLPSSRIVESVIAASIAATALHNLRPVAVNREWAIAFLFGLFHGMGFASLIGALDVSQGTKMVSLLGRNVGIEIGQAVVVLLVFPALFLLRRTTWYRPVFVLGSSALALISLGWMIERLFVVNLNVGRLVEPFLKFPRSILLVAIVAGIAWAIYRAQDRAGQLLPTVDTGG